ncbi:MAG: flagellar biosynthesis protein FlhB [Alphaproteobacteria bacterium]|nr:flagellar biosynthesis protein FlhB [Alphaproteobacteria bacterium]MBO6627523.1 flagellar biosynthesis protein FlhB [Alphaproteobacteria bacterium]MDF1627166.1 flagellar biosynthesis protein FlhB [Parvibaculaceae bacterium]
MSDQADDSEKTEEPTSKKLDDAREKGDVPKSQEVNTWFLMVATTMVIGIGATGTARQFSDAFQIFLSAPHEIAVDNAGLYVLWQQIGVTVLKCIALPMLFLIVGAAAGNLVQHAPVWSTENMKPKLSKISPLAGLKRLFSVKSLMNFAKGILKLTLVGVATLLVVWPMRDELLILMTIDLAALLPYVQVIALKIMAAVLAILTVLAAVDFYFERAQWNKKQRMTQQEVKDEHKQMEGDPTVKAKLRAIRIEKGRKRMMSQVPDASVIITNPTHYAVALKYEQGMHAPICVAKGVDAVALKIREIGSGHDIPIVESPPLARALYATVEVDETIPPEHYKAVAEVIGYVMRLKGKMAKSWRSR